MPRAGYTARISGTLLEGQCDSPAGREVGTGKRNVVQGAVFTRGTAVVSVTNVPE